MREGKHRWRSVSKDEHYFVAPDPGPFSWQRGEQVSESFTPDSADGGVWSRVWHLWA